MKAICATSPAEKEMVRGAVTGASCRMPPFAAKVRTSHVSYTPLPSLPGVTCSEMLEPSTVGAATVPAGSVMAKVTCDVGVHTLPCAGGIATITSVGGPDGPAGESPVAVITGHSVQVPFGATVRPDWMYWLRMMVPIGTSEKVMR